MIKDYLFFALDNIRYRQLRSWLTMIGIFIGIAAVVSLIGLGEGLRVAVTSQFGFLGSDILSVQAAGIAYGPPGTGAVTPLTDDLADKVAKVNGVEVAFNRYMEGGTAGFNDERIITTIGSVPEGETKKAFLVSNNVKVEEGRMLKDGEERKVVLGNAFKGNEIFGKGVKTGDTILINDVDFGVVGILERKGSFILDYAVLINGNAWLDLFGDDGTVEVIAIKVKDPNKIDEVQEDIEKLLRKERDVKKGEEDFIVESPQKILESLNSTLFAVQLFIYIIAGISILVGGIGIMNTMYTAVLERTKQIGIMKSIGAKNSTIFTLFFIESGFLGIVGGCIGVILGWLLAYGFAAAGRMALGSDIIQAHIFLGLITGALIFSFVVGVVAGVLPANQAAKMQPVEALRQIK